MSSASRAPESLATLYNLPQGILEAGNAAGQQEKAQRQGRVLEIQAEVGWRGAKGSQQAALGSDSHASESGWLCTAQGG